MPIVSLERNIALLRRDEIEADQRRALTVSPLFRGRAPIKARFGADRRCEPSGALHVSAFYRLYAADDACLAMVEGQASD
jgi:hypothetical protein